MSTLNLRIHTPTRKPYSYSLSYSYSSLLYSLMFSQQFSSPTWTTPRYIQYNIFLMFSSVSRLDVLFECVCITLYVCIWIRYFPLCSLFMFLFQFQFLFVVWVAYSVSKLTLRRLSFTQRNTDLIVGLPSSYTHTRTRAQPISHSTHTHRHRHSFGNFNVFHSESLAKSSSNPLASKFLLYFAYTHTLAQS